MRRFWFSLLLLPLFALCVNAQSTPATAPAAQITLGQSIVALNGPWKFHIGDNPQWADPNFDDSQWETVDLTPKTGSLDPISGASSYVSGWTAKGHSGYWGWAWYRIRVRVAARPGETLAINGPTDVDDAYQVFADGRLLGSFGRFSARDKTPVYYFSQPRMFPLPQDIRAASPNTYVLAFRFWMAPTSLIFVPNAGGMHSAPLLGQLGVVAARYQLDWVENIRRHLSAAILAVLFFLLTILAGSLFFLDRSDSVYLWIAFGLLVSALGFVSSCLSDWTELFSLQIWDWLLGFFLTPLLIGCWAMVWWVWFRLRRPAWMPKLIGILTLLVAITNVAVGPTLLTHVSRPAAVMFHLASVCTELSLLLLTIWIVLQGIRRQGWEGWLVLPAVLLMGVWPFDAELAVVHLRTSWFPLGVTVSIGTIAYLLLAGVIFVLLLRRLLLSVRRQKEQALDVKQAQEVQQVLIPEELPQVAGLTIESEYRPAREVGGDFFQIIPHPSDGSVLIVVGDVTGHGLQAGMLVALIVGAIRTAAQYEFDPLAVLNALNWRLCGRGHAHATCLALRIASDGTVTLANAGHLPPYRNGKELPMEGALPLGMVASAEFSVMQFQLEPGDRLMLMSDGIAEAKSESGQLFGFERIHEMLRQPITAAAMATAAQKFGQEDDILVLRVERDGAKVAAPVVAV